MTTKNIYHEPTRTNRKMSCLWLSIFFFSFVLLSCENPLMKQIFGLHTVSFNSNGGSKVESQQVMKDETVKRPANPKKEGYSFIGWSEYNYDDDYTLWNFSVAPNKDMVLYAIWMEGDEPPIDAVKVSDVEVTMESPAAGKKPPITAETDKYFIECSVKWDPNDDTFIYGKLYTAAIYLKIKDGYNYIFDDVVVKFDHEEVENISYSSDKEISFFLSYSFPDPNSGMDGSSPDLAFKIYDIETLERVGKGRNEDLWLGDWSFSAHYELIADISLQTNWTPIGTYENAFRGSFNGNGYSISNLTIIGNYDFAGLFGYVEGVSGTVFISNLNLYNVNISGGSNAGGIAGYVNNVKIENCSVTRGNITCGTAGGIVGTAGSVEFSINKCYFSGSIYSSNNAGGIVAVVHANVVSITNCYTTGAVNGGATGGIAGSITNMPGYIAVSNIENCYAACAVNSNGSSGGILRSGFGSNGSIENCVALNPVSNSNSHDGTYISSGRISGDEYVGISFVNNKARSDMLINGVVVIDGSADNKDGADAAIGTSLAAVFSTADGWSTDIWNIPSGNLIVGGALPTLKGFPNVTQNPVLMFTSIEMVQIPEGTFTMGPDIWGNNVSFNVTLSAFKMGKYQVTQEQYEAVMGINPSHFISNPANGEIQGKRPIENVSWFDAIEFCNKLSEMQGLNPVYTITGRTPSAGYPITAAIVTANWNNNGYRLPTEAQWEYACRAGSNTNWYFGDNENELVNYAWYSENSNDMTHEVGKKLPNYFGLHDMHGNVWEWCWDWLGDYPEADQNDYRGVVSGDVRTHRGGCWSHSASELYSLGRGYINLPGGGYNNFGFRVVLP